MKYNIYQRAATTIAIIATAMIIPAFASANGITVSAGSCPLGSVNSNPIIISDGSFIVNGNPATPVTHTTVTDAYWTATVGSASAQWIWSTPHVDDPTVSETKIFTKTFNLTATTSGTLMIAVDDHYTVDINGKNVGNDTVTDPHATAETYNLDSDYFKIGENTITVTVTNDPNTTATSPDQNPAGFILSLSSDSCATASLFGNDSSTNSNQDGAGLFGSDSSTNHNQDGGGLFGSNPSTNPNQDNTGSTTPVITTASDISTTTDSSSGIAVFFTVPTATEGSTTIPVVCSPTSGSVFPIGTTKVLCTATDAANVASTSTFDVIVTSNATPDTSPSNPSPSSSGSFLGSSFGGGGSSAGLSGSTTTIPLSLTLPNSCPLITTFMGLGGKNDSSEVLKLQTFLKNVEGANLSLTGIFDANTIAAVKTFQAKYLVDVMGPWKSLSPSGYVYITTKRKINEIACNSTIILTPEEAAIISAHNKALVNVKPAITAPIETTSTTTVEDNSTGTTTSTTTDIIGSTPNTGVANTATVVNAPVLQRIWDFFKGIFGK